VTPGTPLPTPWQKAEFEAYSNDVQRRRREIRKEQRPEAGMDQLFLAERERESRMLGDCIMFTRDQVSFCAVCRRAIERVIALYTQGAPPAAAR